MKKVLITGANGQLGSEFKALTSDFSSFEFVYTDYDTLDITDRQAVESFFDQVQPEIVVNCAAYTAVDKAETDFGAAHLLNTVAPGILALECRKWSTKMVHISTDYVFDGSSSVPYTENDQPSPPGVYGKTKLDGEINATKENPDVLIIRTSWLYSAWGNNFVKTMLRLGREREMLKVVFDQSGTPTHAQDLARAIMLIAAGATLSPSGWVPGIFHYSNEGVCSWYDFAIAIHTMAGINCKVIPVTSEEYPTTAKRPHFSVFNKSKIKTTYGIQVPYWRDSLEACIKIIQNKEQ